MASLLPVAQERSRRAAVTMLFAISSRARGSAERRAGSARAFDCGAADFSILLFEGGAGAASDLWGQFEVYKACSPIVSDRWHSLGMLRDLECARDGGQFAGWELTGAAGLSEDESHGQAPHP